MQYDTRNDAARTPAHAELNQLLTAVLISAGREADLWPVGSQTKANMLRAVQQTRYMRTAFREGKATYATAQAWYTTMEDLNRVTQARRNSGENE